MYPYSMLYDRAADAAKKLQRAFRGKKAARLFRRYCAAARIQRYRAHPCPRARHPRAPLVPRERAHVVLHVAHPACVIHVAGRAQTASKLMLSLKEQMERQRREAREQIRMLCKTPSPRDKRI